MRCLGAFAMSLATLGLLVGMVAVAIVPSYTCGSNAECARASISTLGRCLNVYYVKHGAYPTALDKLVTDGIVDKLPRDPWGNEFAYSVDGRLAVVTSRGHGERADISSNDLVHR